MLADIASGNTGTADVFFLIAVILFALVGIVRLLRGDQPFEKYSDALIALGLGCVAFGLLLL